MEDPVSCGHVHIGIKYIGTRELIIVKHIKMPEVKAHADEIILIARHDAQEGTVIAAPAGIACEEAAG